MCVRTAPRIRAVASTSTTSTMSELHSAARNGDVAGAVEAVTNDPDSIHATDKHNRCVTTCPLVVRLCLTLACVYALVQNSAAYGSMGRQG